MSPEVGIGEMVSESTIRTFATMLMVDLAPVAADEKPDLSFEFIGMIGFSGDLSGNIAVCTTRNTAKAAAVNFIGEEVSTDAELSDCVGELVNMIAGNAKSSISEKNISLSLPEVVIGSGLKLDFCRFKTRGELFFTSSIGTIAVVFAQN